MKKITPLILLGFISLIEGVNARLAATVPAPPPVEKIRGVVELLDVIKPGAEAPAPGVYKLSCEWIGTLVPFEDKQAQSKLSPKQPEPLRLNCLQVEPDGAIHLVAARFLKTGETSSSRFFKLLRTLHGSEEILQARKLDTLKSWFGNQHGVTDGWGGPDEMHWTEHWMFFSPAQNETIVCQNIFAHVSMKQKTVENGTSLGMVVSSEAARVDIMSFSEGVFRPANPESDEERRMYPSESDKYSVRLAAENARINAHPEPLRSHLKVRHTPDDHDLLAYRAAIDRFRAGPDPQLIRQLIERLDEGTAEMSMLLSDLMDESAGTSYMNLAAWKPENKKTAIKALIDALPEAPGYHVEEVIVMILAETSLVTLKMEEPEFSIDDKAFPRTPTSGGYGGSYMTLRIKEGVERKVVLNRIASELRRRWEAKDFCVERHSSSEPEK